MSAVQNFALWVGMTEFNNAFIVVISAVAVLLSLVKLMRFPSTVSRERCISFLFGLISHTNLLYVTISPFGTKCLGIKAKVIVPVGMRAPIPFASHLSSLVNDICNVVAVGSLSNSLYSSNAPVVGLRTELIYW